MGVSTQAFLIMMNCLVIKKVAVNSLVIMEFYNRAFIKIYPGKRKALYINLSQP